MLIGACGDVGKFSSSAKTPLERFLSGSEFQRGINTQDRIDKRDTSFLLEKCFYHQEWRDVATSQASRRLSDKWIHA